MSDMQRNKGIIKRLSTKETAKEVYNKLIEDGLHDPKWDETDENGVPVYIDSDDYQLINGCMFDVSDAPREIDADDSVEEVERLNDTEYRIHLYFYNGGGSMDEILDEAVPKADKEYEEKDNKVINDLAKYYLIKKQTELETKIEVYKEIMEVLDPAATRTEFVFKVQNALEDRVHVCEQKLKELKNENDNN